TRATRDPSGARRRRRGRCVPRHPWLRAGVARAVRRAAVTGRRVADRGPAMSFCTRVFCREPAPSLSEILVWMRQQGTPVTIVGGRSEADLLSIDWTEVELSYDPDEEPLTVRCHHAADGDGGAVLRAEAADFLADIAELPASEARDRVRRQVEAARLLVV